MVCNKCRQREALAGDTWCIVCSAWESLGTAIVGKWGTAAVRSVADEVLVAAARHTRALRNLDAGLAARAKSEASKPKRPEEGLGGVASGSGISRERSPLPRPRSVVPDSLEVKKEAADSEYTYETESASEEVAPKPRVSGKERPAEPAEPPATRSQGKAEETGSRRSREEKKEKKAGRDSHRKEGKERRRKKRGGRKHKRLSRTLDNPSAKVHRALPPIFWEQSLERRSHLSPPRR